MTSYQWGSYSESDECYGLHRIHMVVYPPATSSGDRTWLRVWRAWPIVGLLVGAALYSLIAGQLSTAPAMTVAVVVPLAVGAGLAVRVRAIRSQVAEVLTLTPPRARFGHPAAGLIVAERLIDASARHRRGELDDAAYRRDWQRAYDYLRGAARGATTPSAPMTS
ncbi:hypothetical protein HH308_01940 [Gordonia sp. TBRC 11910]|uniref:Uncharacterized protein n=1 Tax=Gordonia asplenii TaxID=2725283 RepID=A0A848KLK0_9ACTN|nr:DUF6611 family protein [Gordonia asplenii]NMN99973.1 hypothetical protein [Gordonia asplenii]